VSPRERRVRRAGNGRPRWYRKRGFVWTVGTVFALLVVLGVLATVRLVKVAHDLQRARDLLQTAGQQIEQGQLGGARTNLDEAQKLLTRSNNQLYNDPSLDILGVLPVVHQNLSSLRGSVGLALRMTDGGSHILSITQPLESPSGKLEVPFVNGQIPLKAVQDAQAATDQLAAVLPQKGVRPNDSLVVGPISHAQDQLYDQAALRRTELVSVSHGLKLLQGLSGEDGPKTYLIAVANTAEMRGSGGMILSYGTLHADHGTFTLGDFGRIDDLLLDNPVDPASLKLPSDFMTRWGELGPTQLWRNANVNPDFQFDAPILEAMYKQKTGDAVDGVIQIDPAGLGAILRGTGPILVDQLGVVDADNVVDVTLNRAYIDVPDRDQRQELLGDVAREAFKKLVGGHLDSLRPLGQALFDAALGRHVMFYGNDPSVEAETAFFNASGAMPAPDAQDYAVLTVQNFSKNKLDYYVDTSLQLDGDRPSKKQGHLTATITVANTAPTDGSSTYVFGPNDVGETRGLYRGIVSLYLPNGVTLDGSSGDPTTAAPVVTGDGGRTAVTFTVEVPAGQQRAVTLRLTLAPRPTGDYQFQIVPIGRIRPTVVGVDITADRTKVVRAPAPLTAPAVLRPAS